MKKFLVFVFLAVWAVVMSGCGLLRGEEFSDDYVAACYDQGGLMSQEGCVSDKTTEDLKIEEPEVVEVEKETSDCLERAEKIGAPEGSAICNEATSGAPAQRVQSGSEVSFGSITFDAETRVWILEKFIVPNGANYSYDYTGRERNIMDAPFVVGGEKNPVNGENFTICWDTTSEGCTPPMAIEFFQ